MIDSLVKLRIDEMGYEEMLRLWRFSPLGDPLFQGEVGDYFAEVMKVKKEKLSHEERVQVSKEIGWAR